MIQAGSIINHEQPNANLLIDTLTRSRYRVSRVSLKTLTELNSTTQLIITGTHFDRYDRPSAILLSHPLLTQRTIDTMVSDDLICVPTLLAVKAVVISRSGGVSLDLTLRP